MASTLGANNKTVNAGERRCLRVAKLSVSQRFSVYDSSRTRKVLRNDSANDPGMGLFACHKKIKHDGFRIIARKNGAQVRLYSRPGNDLTPRFPLIVETLAACARAPALSTAKLPPAMTTALPRSIYATSALTGAYSSTPST
jgi:hypothetical protein